VREILAGGKKEAITALIAKDKELEPEANAIAAVDNSCGIIAICSNC